jgi:hypothetical protein
MNTNEKLHKEKLEALRRDIQAGIDELDKGKGIPGEQVFTELKKRNEALKRKKSLRKIINSDDRLTLEEAESVRRGMEQIKRGEYVPWEQIKKELDL